MENSILNFAKQFDFDPEIINVKDFGISEPRFILGGMGGSHLAAGLFQKLNPEIDLSIHRDYGLPFVTQKNVSSTIFIACSHSGNTEETLDFADEAYSRNLPLIIVTSGGRLLDFAKENSLPFILLPNDGIQPRTATGYFILALCQIILPAKISELKAFGKNIQSEKLRSQGKELAHVLQNKVPIIYSSAKNRPIAYNWKIKINETGKIPAFYNSFPELNHNEMQGFDHIESNSNLSSQFHFIFLHDSADHERIEKRMKVTEQTYQEKGLSVSSIYLEGDNVVQKIFHSLILADWIALEIAAFYKTEPEKVPLIEKFKGLL